MGFGYGLPRDRVEWTVLTIGRVTRNKFWGEVDPVRAPFCTSTLIHGPAGMVLVDPSVPPDRMAELLQCQAGLTPADIGHVFVTHFHHDHRAGLAAFPNARWLMAETEIAWWRGQATPEEQRVLDRMVPAGAEPFPGFQARPAPGHTPGLTALCFAWRGKRVAIAGDAVMTEEYFRAGDVHVKSADFDQARASLHRLGREADLVVPGHDLPFVVAWAG